MTEPQKPTAQSTEPAKKPSGAFVTTSLTAAQAAKMVHRLTYERDDKGQPKKDKGGEFLMHKVEVPAKDVMSFAEYADRIVVVTTAGEKLVAPKK